MKEILKNIGLITQLGLSVIVPILIFVLGFAYLDQKIQAEGKLIILGVVIGVISGVVSAYRLVRKYFKK
ncbi:MAG TPA: AtpZ/AtpI family protein [Candidatus Cloacimonadota bacterium]|nr:AtpZ/AtpI family protein [Candidatus Cloacimonadota bacterium]